MISREALQKYLRYEPETGLFFWGEYKTFVPGSAAGRVGDKGYVGISLNGFNYRAHRLAWVIVYGEIPEDMHIDHINGVKTDNRIANLRLATNSQNGMNRPQVRTTTTGYKGVSKRYNKFAAYIKLDGNRLYLGLYSTPQEAHQAYCTAALKYHGEFANFGQSQPQQVAEKGGA